MSMGTIRNLCILALLMVVSVAGCGREQLPVLVPTVIATAPASGATAVALNTAVTAGFSLTMAPATINATTFTLTGPGGVAVAGAVTYAGTTATFTPTVPLAASSVYTATITTGAQSARGSALAANFVWSFTTGAPTVISTVPATGAMAVAVNTLVTATFSEAMNPATINGTTFTLTGPGATPVGGIVTYSGSTATFTPTTILAANTLFTATITTGAKDPAGAALAANFVWTFTTAPPPTVVFTVPVNGATAVAVNTTITATFSEAMNPATINGTTFTVTGPGATPVAGAVNLRRNHRDVHADDRSCRQYPIYSHHHYRSDRPDRQSAGGQLCVDFHHRVPAHRDFYESGPCCDKRADQPENHCDL